MSQLEIPGYLMQIKDSIWKLLLWNRIGAPVHEGYMVRLGFVLHLFIGATLSGAAMIGALVMGFATMQALALAALIGFIAAFPVTYYVARALHGD